VALRETNHPGLRPPLLEKRRGVQPHKNRQKKCPPLADIFSKTRHSKASKQNIKIYPTDKNGHFRPKPP